MSSRNRIIAVLLAVSYGLVVTVSGLWHNHGDACNGCWQIAPAAAHDHAPHSSHGDHSAHRGGPCQQPSSPQCPTDGRNCVVCQFLAQKTLPAGLIAEVTLVALVQDVVPARLPHPVAIVSPAWHSRAPPDFS